MRYLLKKMLRDFRSMSRQFIAIFLMAFIAMLIYSGMEGTWYGMEVGIQRYFEETDIADAWAMAQNFSEDYIDGVSQIDGIKSVEGRMVFSVTPIDNPNGSIEITSFSTLKSSRPVLIDGTELNEEEQGLWLAKEYAEKNSLAVGDVISIDYNGEVIDFAVLGIISEAEYVYYLGNNDEVLPDYSQYGYAYINKETLNKKLRHNNVNRLFIKYEDNVNEKEVKSEIYNKLSNQGTIILDHNQNKSIRGVNDKIQQLYKISLMFSSIFVLLALLTIVTTMRRIVKTQKIQIGTLKGLGVSKGTIVFHYALYGFIISLLGVVLGILMGPRLLSPVLLAAQLKTYSIPDVESQLNNISIMMGAFIVIACTVATIFASLKGLRGVPAENMRNVSMQKVKSKNSKLVGLLSFEWRWILRETFNNKVRFIMGVVGVTGCMMLVMATRGLQDSAHYANDYLYKEVYTYEQKITVTPEFDQNSIDKKSDEYQMVQENTIEILKHDEKKVGTVTVIGSGNFIHLSNMKDEAINIDNNEGIISHKLSEVLGVTIGDIIEIKDYTKNEYLYLKITEISNIPSPQGIFMSKDTWNALGREFVPTSILSKDNNSSELIKDNPAVNNVTNKSDLSISVNKLLDTFKMIFLLLNVAAITMGVVILYNLGTLNYTEKSREYATLKVLGYKPREIFALSIRESLLTTIIGVLVAIPCGYKFLEIYVKTVSVESFEWLIKLNNGSFITALTVTIICSLGINILVAIKINKINMIDSLKSVE